jgi:hypothetical protein
VILGLVGNKPPTIKPGDLVRTRSGRTARCLEIRARGFRLIADVATQQQSIVHAEELFLVRSAPPRRWPSYELA